MKCNINMYYAYLQQQAEQIIINYINKHAQYSPNVTIIDQKDACDEMYKMIKLGSKETYTIHLGHIYNYFKTRKFTFENLKMKVFEPMMKIFNINTSDFSITTSKFSFIAINDLKLSQTIHLSSSLSFLIDPMNCKKYIHYASNAQNSDFANIPKIIEKYIYRTIYKYFLFKTYFKINFLPLDIFNIISINMI